MAATTINSVIRGIHHVEIVTKSLTSTLKVFIQCMGFSPAAVHENGAKQGTLIANNDVTFLLREDTTNIVDSVVDVAFVIDSLDKFSTLVSNQLDYDIYQCPYTGLCAIDSCVTGLRHTLIQRAHHNQFIRLPGFQYLYTPELLLPHLGISTSTNRKKLPVPDFSNAFIDHVAFACQPGESQRVMEWYHGLFGFDRYYINKLESESGFIVSYKESGMNLKALSSCGDSSHCDSDVKLVFAESLNNDDNQINNFTRAHGGTGLQHVAINLGDNFVDSVRSLRARGLPFVDPPSSYYNELGKHQEILNLGLDSDAIIENNILVDAETSVNDSPAQSCLMQVFTKPLLSEETFFMEFISRQGARGFGTGNISALWQAVEIYMQGQSVRSDRQDVEANS